MASDRFLVETHEVNSTKKEEDKLTYYLDEISANVSKLGFHFLGGSSLA